MFALVDANSFYASAEAVFNPKWRRRAIIILSNNDGVIVAANSIALKLGIKKFQPYFKVASFCKQNNIIVCSSNYELYADLSLKMMQTIARFAPEQYIYSIDESFLNFTGLDKNFNYELQALKIRRSVWKECRLPVCVGVGPTLTLAKIANHIAKQEKKHNGVFVLNKNDPTQIKQSLLSTPINKVWGIGKSHAKKFKHRGIDNAWLLAQFDPKKAHNEFSIEIKKVILELRGEKCKSYVSNNSSQQQFFSTRSIGTRITDIYSLKQALVKHANIASANMRSNQLLCSKILIFAHNSVFDKEPLLGFKELYSVLEPTDNIIEIAHIIEYIIKHHFNPNIKYYKIGIGLLDLVAKDGFQPDLFTKKKYDPKLMSIFDRINNNFGKNTLLPASHGHQHKWHMWRNFTTPQYTTNWYDIPKIRCD